MACFTVFAVGVRADEDDAKEAAGKGATNAPKSPGEESGAVRLTNEQIAKAGITTAAAGPGRLSSTLMLPGEIKLNADKTAHVSPRVPGVVAQVNKALGDPVHAGEIMAVIESRELAAAKAAYVAARERLALSKTTYAREKSLWEKKISAEQDYLAAKQALAEAQIELKSSEQQLRALGLSKEALGHLDDSSNDAFTRFEILSPIDGTVIEKSMVLGESLLADASVFVVADLHSVWMDFKIQPKDLSFVRVGQAVAVTETPGNPPVTGPVSYIGPVMDQESRAALARVLLPNDDGRWKPGQFVTVSVALDSREVPIAVPKTALQNMGGKTVLFVRTQNGFEAAPVILGASSDTQAEILSGIEAGQTYAATGVFILKAESEKRKEE